MGLEALDRAGAATFGCAAPQVTLETEGRTVRRGGPRPAAVRRAVLLRDQCRCRVPGCTRRRYVDVHHILEQARGGAHSRGNCLVLCTTHHRLLHEGKLLLSGDAEGELSFCDSDGAPIVEPACTFDIHQAPPPSATQGGSRGEVQRTGFEHSTEAPDASARLLRVMGHRGGWTVDHLVEQSGLSVGAVSTALTFLELDGRVRRSAFGFASA